MVRRKHNRGYRSPQENEAEINDQQQDQETEQTEQTEQKDK